MRLWVISAALLAVGLHPAAGLAHPGVDDRIHHLDHQIEHHPRDPQLYLQRGELHVEDSRFDDAERDFARAARLAPELSEVHYYRGTMLVEAKDFAKAEAELTAFIETAPTHVKAHLLRARARMQLEKYLEAHEDYSVAIREAETVTVQPYYDRARALLKAGDDHHDDALRGLEEGCRRLGSPPVLVELALEIEAGQGRGDAALQWLDKLPANLREAPHWLHRRGDLLVASGRRWEGLVTYTVALAKLVQLPEARQSTPAMQALAQQLRRSIAQTARW